MEVREYVAANGKAPFSSWIAKIRDRQVRARIRTRVSRIRVGNFGDCKPIGEGVFELRLQFGPGYRVYFGREHEQLILLLCGGDKGTQDRDIQRAKEMWNEYRTRDDESE